MYSTPYSGCLLPTYSPIFPGPHGMTAPMLSQNVHPCYGASTFSVPSGFGRNYGALVSHNEILNGQLRFAQALTYMRDQEEYRGCAPERLECRSCDSPYKSFVHGRSRGDIWRPYDDTYTGEESLNQSKLELLQGPGSKIVKEEGGELVPYTAPKQLDPAENSENNWVALMDGDCKMKIMRKSTVKARLALMPANNESLPQDPLPGPEKEYVTASYKSGGGPLKFFPSVHSQSRYKKRHWKKLLLRKYFRGVWGMRPQAARTSVSKEQRKLAKSTRKSKASKSRASKGGRGQGKGTKTSRPPPSPLKGKQVQTTTKGTTVGVRRATGGVQTRVLRSNSQNFEMISLSMTGKGKTITVLPQD